jgi:hypothetical protein
LWWWWTLPLPVNSVSVVVARMDVRLRRSKVWTNTSCWAMDATSSRSELVTVPEGWSQEVRAAWTRGGNRLRHRMGAWVGSSRVRGVADDGSGTGGETASGSASTGMSAMRVSCGAGTPASEAGLGVLGTECGAGPSGRAGVTGLVQDDRPRTSEVSIMHVSERAWSAVARTGLGVLGTECVAGPSGRAGRMGPVQDD